MIKLKIALITLFLALAVVFVVPNKVEAEEMPVTFEGSQVGDNLIIYTDDMEMIMHIKDIYVQYKYYAYNETYIITNVQFNIFMYQGRNFIRVESVNEVLNYLITPTQWRVNEELYFGINVFVEDDSEAYITFITSNYNITSTSHVFTYDFMFETQDENEFRLYGGEIWTTFSKNYHYLNQEKSYRDGLEQGRINGLQEGRDIGYGEGYNKGYNLGIQTAENDFNALFSGVANTPIQILHSVLSFDIFGVNIFNVIFSILTLLLLIWLIKRFM